MVKNRPIQMMIIMGVLALVCTIGVQVYWVSISVTAEEETFDHNVRMSMRAVADNMCQIDGNELIANKPIDRISRNYFVARLQYNIDVSVLDSLIQYQFEQRGIHQDFEYGVYNCETDRMVFGSQVSLADDRKANRLSLPKLAADEYYFGVYFPNKTGGLLANLTLWKYMTAATVLMLIFFAYGLVVVLKQRRLSEIQKDFIDNITHELKTPLATLKLATDAIRINQDGEKVNKYTEILHQEITRLEEMVNQILTSSFIGQKETKKIFIDLDELLSEQFSIFKEAYSNLKWQIDLPKLGTVMTNPEYLIIAIRNLVDNSSKYGYGLIAVNAKRTTKNIEIIFSDNGPGISKRYHKKVFTKFFRIPNKNVHDVKGYGLGLYIVKMYLRQIGCSISLDDIKEGTQFTIQIPVNK